MIFVPHVNLTAATAAALDAAGRPWRAVDVSASVDEYWRLLYRLWLAGDEFAIVEHDIAPGVDALDSLDECLGDWCACPYLYVHGQPHAGLGCARFRTPLIGRHPDLMTVVAEMSDEGHPQRHWCRLDAWITNTLTRRGETRCEAHPAVYHAMADPQSSAHGCYHI